MMDIEDVKHEMQEWRELWEDVRRIYDRVEGLWGHIHLFIEQEMKELINSFQLKI